MARTIYILGMDSQECQELREILQERIADPIVTAHGQGSLPSIKESDTVVITSEKNNTGVLYQRLLDRLEDQAHRAELLGELLSLFSASLHVKELLNRVVSKSTQVLGDTAFIVMSSDPGQIKLEAAFSKDPQKDVQGFITAINSDSEALNFGLLNQVLSARQPVIVSNLQQSDISGKMRSFMERHSLESLLAVPIQTKEALLGAFISLAPGPKVFTNDDLATASALADFTATALENASLFAELQRSAITDSLTGVYNTRFFHEVLARETARANRYTAPLSLLMIDIDTFKVVNDTFGHVVGNKVLTQTAKTLERTVRTTDFVFRCGGDEFGVILPATNLEDALKVGEKILHRVEDAAILTSLGYSGPMTVSIGVSEYCSGTHFETLVAAADQALYTSKRSSRNCVSAFKADDR